MADEARVSRLATEVLLPAPTTNPQLRVGQHITEVLLPAPTTNPQLRVGQMLVEVLFPAAPPVADRTVTALAVTVAPQAVTAAALTSGGTGGVAHLYGDEPATYHGPLPTPR